MVRAATLSAADHEPGSISTQIGRVTRPRNADVSIVLRHRWAAVALVSPALPAPRDLARNFDAALPVDVGHSTARMVAVAMADATTPSSDLPAMWPTRNDVANRRMPWASRPTM